MTTRYHREGYDTYYAEGPSPTRDRLIEVRDRMQTIVERDNPGDWVWWWIAERPFTIPEHTLETLQRGGEALQRFFRAANDLFFDDPTVRQRLEKTVSPNYRRLNDARRPDLPVMPRPDVVVDRNWNPKFVELEITVCARAETTTMSELYGNQPAHQLVDRYADYLAQQWPGGTLGLLAAPHPFWVDLPDDANGFGKKIARRGIDVELLTGDELPLLRYDGEALRLHKPDGTTKTIEVVDRFIDIYEIAELNHPGMNALLDAYLDGAVDAVNTFKQSLDEKEWMALFWEEQRADYWRRELGDGDFELLREMIPRTWRVDPDAEITPTDHRALPMRNLGEIPADRRNFIVKESGTSTTSSGAQSVRNLAKIDPGEIAPLLEELGDRKASFILQETVDSARIDFTALDPLQERVVREFGARIKMSPFYIDGELTDIKFIASNQKLTVNDEACVESVVDRTVGGEL